MTTPTDSTLPRLDVKTVAPALFNAQLQLETAVRQSSLEPITYELIKIRASQINGCAYCLDMHTLDAMALGETTQRLNVVAAWHEAPFFTERERAALALTEAVTLISVDHVPDDTWEQAAAAFSPEELAAVIMAIVVINGWNRMAIAGGLSAGHYTPGQHHH